MQRRKTKLSARSILTRWLALSLSFLILPLWAACGRGDSDEALADYGNFGAELAEKIAALGARPSGSAQEAAAGDLVFASLQAMGYQPERQEVTLSTGGKAQNILVRIPGAGFLRDHDSDLDDLFRTPEELQKEASEETFARTNILAARLCTESMPDTDTSGMDGISDNASGIAALLTFAKELKKQRSGYDILLAFVAGGTDDYVGTRTLLGSLSEAARAKVECFYEVRNIYAGTRLYASAGWSSIAPEHRYPLRRKAYALTDVSIESGLWYETGQDVLLNESDYNVKNPLDGKAVPYREFTLRASDYRVFDERAIPTVFLEAYDYSASSFEGLRESQSLNFSETNGRVAGTRFDRKDTLKTALGKDRLRDRVNAAAFLLLGAMKKDPARSTALTD